MSTITREFTKEQLQQIIETDHVQCGEASALARIALASLEAEFVGEVSEQRDGLVMDGTVDLGGASTHRIIKGASKMKRLPLGTKFYTSPPAPANAEPVAWLWSHRKHPSEVTLVRPEDDEMAEGSRWSGWSCQALYAAPPAPASVPDGYRLQPISEYDAMCAAMLQGADGNSPAHSGCRPAQNFTPPAQCGNSPVIPDGWVLVPVEPTEDMIVNGFESEPDESFSDEREWEAYDAMSGCQQAAHRARLCWAAMLAAAPRPEA